MTITQSTPRANPVIAIDLWLSVDQLLENYPFLQSSGPEPGRRIYRLRDLRHFPQHDGRAGRLLLWRNQRLKPGSPTDQSRQSARTNSTNQSAMAKCLFQQPSKKLGPRRGKEP